MIGALVRLAAIAALSVAAAPLDDTAPLACGKPCVIEFSPGGSVVAFRLEGLKLLSAGTPIIVDGPCLSACTLLIDVARRNVCLTTGAILGYHKQSFTDDAGVKHYGGLWFETPGLNAYIGRRGGLPEDDVLLIPFDQARAFYRPCAGAT